MNMVILNLLPAARAKQAGQFYHGLTSPLQFNTTSIHSHFKLGAGCYYSQVFLNLTRQMNIAHLGNRLFPA